MDLLQMKYVVAIADSESMTKAAEALHVSQSALSLSYKRLEEELGVKLFIRDGRTLRLTTPGKKFYEKACTILDLVTELERDMTLKNVLEFSTEAGDFTNEARMLYLSLFPEQEIMELRENSMDTLKSVRDGDVSFAVTYHDFSDEHLASELILEEPMYAFVSEQSPLSKFGTLSMNHFHLQPLVTQKADYAIANVMMEYFQKAGVTPGRRYFVNDPEAMSLTVFNNQGLTFIPESIVNLWKRSPFDMAPGTKMIPMEETFCQRKIYLTYHRNIPKSALTRHYMDYLRHFGRLAQRLRDIPTTAEMENYAKKYWPEFCVRDISGPQPVI